MTHQWKVGDFIQEMGHLEKLIQRKGGGQLVQRMTMSLCTKLKAAKHWTSQAILELVDALQGSGLPNDQMKAIQEAVDCIGLNEGSHLRVTMAGQHIEGFPSYISKKDWARLEEAPKNTVHTMSILAMRLRSMGSSCTSWSTKVVTGKAGRDCQMNSQMSLSRPFQEPWQDCRFLLPTQMSWGANGFPKCMAQMMHLLCLSLVLAGTAKLLGLIAIVQRHPFEHCCLSVLIVS